MGRKRKYNTEEERIAARREKNRRYYHRNKGKEAKRQAERYQKNKGKILEQKADYYSTKYGRANRLLNLYRHNDRKKDMGECTLTAEWIVDNIFSGQVCHYCGESDWTKLGCDRKDSWFPHTPENCIPCCKDCNIKKHNTPYDLYMKMIGKIA